MPRIDPERLLKCLQPLLDTTTGAIKSTDEVDKILGLMSKFSKKLVSKCIYINILRSSHISVVDLFMQRGGWNLVFGWTNEAVTARNFSLLREILELLIHTPTSVSRLKENKFPLLVKSLSKDCEDSETKRLAKEVVVKWISIAKEEDNQNHLHQVGYHQHPVGNLELPMDQMTNHSITNNINQDLASADSLLNIEPSLIPEPGIENQFLLDSLNSADLANIDFNLDILNKVVDPAPDESAMEMLAATNQNAGLAPGGVQMYSNQNAYSIQTPVSNVQLQQPQQALATTTPEVLEMYPVQSAPKIYIKTIAGQRTVVQGLGAEAGQFCLLIQGDKNYVVKVKDTNAPATSTQDASNQVPKVSSDVPDSSLIKEKKVKKKDKEEKAGKSKSGEQSSTKLLISPKAKSPSTSKDGSSKKSSENLKPTEKDKKEKSKSKDKSSSSDGHKKSKSSSSRSKGGAAAAAAKQHADEEKLREEIRKQKALVKQRAIDQGKQKQQEKDQETLKKLNLAPSSTSPSAMKIPKIPRKTSFIDAIGIPGSDGSSSVDKIKKLPSSDKDKTEKEKSSKSNDEASSLTKKTSKVENEESDKPKERKHKVKVFVNPKSRSDDLLNAMIESGKSKSSKEKEKEDAKAKPTTSLGNSIPAVPPKVSKRLSTESIEKSDSKKPRLEKTDKSTDDKEKEKKKPTTAIKESSLFMDVLNASSENTKSVKRKRRPSTGNDKEIPSPIDKSAKPTAIKESNEGTEAQGETGNSTPNDTLKKPVFNFYRDTLNDSPEQEKDEVKMKQEQAEPNQSAEVEAMEVAVEGSFTPQETDGKLKSALCIIRARNRPRKSVRWKEEEELKEFHYFELDETERVNVTRQKDFTEMSQHEKAVEKSYSLRNKMVEEEQQDSQSQWKLYLIEFAVPRLMPVINSREKDIQEERERNVLGLFLPPGAALPDTASEPDPASPSERTDSKSIPVEDVNGITNVCDFRTFLWPKPKGLEGGNPYGFNNLMQQQQLKEPQSHAMNTFSASTDFSNPWNSASLGFSVPPPVPNVADMSAFQQFPPPVGGLPINMNFLGTAPPPLITFPPAPTGNNPFSFPPPSIVPPLNGVVDAFGGNNRDARGGNHNRGRFNDADQRRNFHGARDRDNGGRDRGSGRDRDYRDDRGGRDRRRDRDTNDRDYRHHDRDRNSRDYRSGWSSSGRNNRKEIPCKYFRKGHCSNGSRCEYLHDASNNHEEKGYRQDSQDYRSRKDSYSNDGDRKQSMDDDWEGDNSSSSDRRNSSGSAVDTDSRFALPPSSPTEPSSPDVVMLPSENESTIVIPVD